MDQKAKTFKSVGELIEYLKQFNPSTPLLIDQDGNTWPVEFNDIRLWNTNDRESPVAIFV